MKNKNNASRIGNVAVEIDAAVLSRGFHSFEHVSLNERHRVFIATGSKGEKVLFKATAVPVEIRNLRNEAEAHQFLRSMTPKGARFTFPDTEILEDSDVFVSVQPFVPSGWFARKTPFRLKRKFTDDDLEDVFQAMLFMHRIRYAKLPASLRRTARSFTLNERFDQHRKYFEPALGTLISKSEAKSLVEMMRDIGYHRAFVHHDIGPTNMARLPGGKLLLADAEFARWGMKWYDVAYSFLQLALLHGQRSLSKRWLKYLVRRFKEELPEEDLEREIFFPLGYWIAANMFIAMKEPRQRPRVRRMFEAIMTGNLDEVLNA